MLLNCISSANSRLRSYNVCSSWPRQTPDSTEWHLNNLISLWIYFPVQISSPTIFINGYHLYLQSHRLNDWVWNHWLSKIWKLRCIHASDKQLILFTRYQSTYTKITRCALFGIMTTMAYETMELQTCVFVEFWLHGDGEASGFIQLVWLSEVETSVRLMTWETDL